MPSFYLYGTCNHIFLISYNNQYNNFQKLRLMLTVIAHRFIKLKIRTKFMCHIRPSQNRCLHHLKYCQLHPQYMKFFAVLTPMVLRRACAVRCYEEHAQ